MDRNRILLAVLVVVAVVGVALAATAFEAASFGDGAAGEPGGSDGTGAPAGPAISETTGDGPLPVEAIAAALQVLVTLLFLVGMAGLVWAMARGHISPIAIAVLVALIAVAAVVIYFFTQFQGANPPEQLPPSGGIGESTGTPGGGGGDPGTGSDAPSTIHGEVLAVLAALTFLGGLALYVVSRSSPDRSATDAADVDEEAREIGEAAGDAADRMSETGLSNAVFRAWEEMTGALDVDDPETTTPAEFEAAAVDAGIAPADARTLTALFREVRYGDEPATPAREEQAEETLRRIEASYATPAADETGGGTSGDAADGADPA